MSLDPKKGDTFYWIEAEGDLTAPESFCVLDVHSDVDSEAPHFRTREHAEAMCHALNVSLLLRAQPGVVEARDGEPQWVIETEKSVYATCLYSCSVKFDSWSPCFETPEAAQAAIDAVGEQEILKAMKAWQGVY